jgi:hypothetical protein
MGVQTSWCVRRFLGNFRIYGSRRERAMTRAALLRYFCAHFWLAMKKVHYFFMQSEIGGAIVEY